MKLTSEGTKTLLPVVRFFGNFKSKFHGTRWRRRLKVEGDKYNRVRRIWREPERISLLRKSLSWRVDTVRLCYYG